MLPQRSLAVLTELHAPEQAFNFVPTELNRSGPAVRTVVGYLDQLDAA